MRVLRGLGSRIISTIEARQTRIRLKDPSPLGDFYRRGGNDQLYGNLPLSETDWVIDVGGYHGEWTAGILARYGCRSAIFEPVPRFYARCEFLFRHNKRVKLYQSALGASPCVAKFIFSEAGTSQFKAVGAAAETFEAFVVGVSDFLQQMRDDGRLKDTPGAIGCIKLNIEGGEYDVLEELLRSGDIVLFRTLLLQFHRQPDDYARRYEVITKSLAATHQRTWFYPMVWERYDLFR